MGVIMRESDIEKDRQFLRGDRKSSQDVLELRLSKCPNSERIFVNAMEKLKAVQKQEK